MDIIKSAFSKSLYTSNDESIYAGKQLVFGILAQLGEHLPYKQRVIGSSPIGPILAK